MPLIELAGKQYDVDEDGFLQELDTVDGHVRRRGHLRAVGTLAGGRILDDLHVDVLLRQVGPRRDRQDDSSIVVGLVGNG